jgi:hypothetical protein
MKLDAALDAILSLVDPGSLSFYHPSRDFIITDSVITQEQAKKITLD